METDTRLLNETIEVLAGICHIITSPQVYVSVFCDEDEAEAAEALQDTLRTLLCRAGKLCGDIRPDLFEDRDSETP